MYLAIAGNIGAGKSSLTRILSDYYALSPIFEAVDENPYLEDFYADMTRFAFHSQIFFLSARLKQHLRYVNQGNRIIQDRTIFEDAHIFARNLFETKVMSARDYACYQELYQAMIQALRPPDVLIYLKASLPTLQARIKARGRDYEQAISPEYLAQLNELYDNFIADYQLSAVYIVDADQLDFVHRPEDLAVLTKGLDAFNINPPILPLKP